MSVVQVVFPKVHSASSIGSGSAFDFVFGILIPTFGVCFYSAGESDDVSEELEKNMHKLPTFCSQNEAAGGPLIPAARIEGWVGVKEWILRGPQRELVRAL